MRLLDEGPGLDEAILDQVFEPFFTTKATGQGTGLGLAIVERILSNHGGRVWARNTGSGAEFGFWLPIAD